MGGMSESGPNQPIRPLPHQSSRYSMPRHRTPSTSLAPPKHLEKEGQVAAKGWQRSTQEVRAVAQQRQQRLAGVAVVSQHGGPGRVCAHPAWIGGKVGVEEGRIHAW